MDDLIKMAVAIFTQQKKYWLFEFFISKYLKLNIYDFETLWAHNKCPVLR